MELNISIAATLHTLFSVSEVHMLVKQTCQLINHKPHLLLVCLLEIHLFIYMYLIVYYIQFGFLLYSCPHSLKLYFHCIVYIVPPPSRNILCSVKTNCEPGIGLYTLQLKAV